MPELPEVEITRLKLTPIIGKIITSFWTDMSKNVISNLSVSDIKKDLQGYQVDSLTRIGKVLFIHVRQDNKPTKILAFHQRMSGRFKISQQTEEPAKHTRAILTFSDKTQLHFLDPRKFGIIWYAAEKELMKFSYLQTLGPDALDISLPEFLFRLKKYNGMIKPVLLRQEIVAGIGNIVVDETLWRARIHPQTQLSSLTSDQLATVHRALQEVLQKSIKAKGSTLKDWKHPDGNSGTFVDYMNVYGKKGQACSRCQTKIVRTVVGGRGTWICTTCQTTS